MQCTGAPFVACHTSDKSLSGNSAHITPRTSIVRVLEASLALLEPLPTARGVMFRRTACLLAGSPGYTAAGSCSQSVRAASLSNAAAELKRRSCAALRGDHVLTLPQPHAGQLEMQSVPQ